MSGLIDCMVLTIGEAANAAGEGIKASAYIAKMSAVSAVEMSKEFMAGFVNGIGDTISALQNLAVEEKALYSPALPLAGGTRYSTLRTATGFDAGQVAPGTFAQDNQNGRWVENHIPIIVLVDEYVASAGESTLNYLRAMDNVIVVGSNTTGAQLCGNVMDLFLPNSGTHFRFGSGIGFQYDTSNKDFRGYEPDIWCNPKDSLDAVMKMAERYDIAADVSGMDNALENVVTSKADITLYLIIDIVTGEIWPVEDPALDPGERTGMPMIDAAQCWMVYKDGVPRSDYIAWSANPDICKITPIEGWSNNTIFEARTTGHGTCKFYVTVDGETAEFIWYAG